MNLIGDEIDFDSYFAQQADESAKIRPASEWAAEVIERMYGERSAKTWISTGFDKMDDKFKLRTSEVTLWAGINKHGKTTMLSQVMLRVMESGQKVCLMSLEMPPAASLEKMVKQAAGTESPSKKYIQAFHKWTDNRLWIYNHVGKLPTARVMAVATYIRKELGIDHLVVDSLMKCGMGADDYNAQKDFVDSLCAIARDTGLHIHLVAHMRKGENERSAPGKFDVKGAGEITDLVDNIMIVWKNLRKIEKPNDPEVAKEPDGYLRVAGQRHFSWEGSFAFWFDKGSQQFLEHEHSRPTYVNVGQTPVPEVATC
jgi:twinkle protein